ncbi:holo-ACP synthase [Comamonadaceae bacterium OH2310_COT-174]|nr:holo-ACP synthase [Comamonadaceae bacterium OH2310_COT-174]
MIYGIGTDICDIRRIEQALQRHGERFAQKVLADGELATWRARAARSPQRGVRFVATRFAVKEAFSKAIGLGMRQPMGWRDCEVANGASGQPQIITHGALRQWCAQRGLQFHISLSDEQDYAVAFCIAQIGAAPGTGAIGSTGGSGDE